MDKNKASDAVKAVNEQKEQKEPVAAAAAKKDDAEKQLDDYKDSLQRLQAEFENYKKRVDKEKQQFRQFAAAEVVRCFLSVLDSFELALKSVNKNSSCSEKPSAAANDAQIVKGLELIYGQFYSALESHGLRPINAVGGRLDPYRHEVLLQEETPDEKKDGLVAEEFQKGYMLNDTVLRYSKVKVLKFKAKEGKAGGSISSGGSSDVKNK